VSLLTLSQADIGRWVQRKRQLEEKRTTEHLLRTTISRQNDDNPERRIEPRDVGSRTIQSHCEASEQMEKAMALNHPIMASQVVKILYQVCEQKAPKVIGW
jgi:hypothetical protein